MPSQADSSYHSNKLSSDSDQYRGPDRRRYPTPALSKYTFFGGKRFNHRRIQEAHGAYVDLYSRSLVIFLLIFFSLTVLDSVSTLIYLEKGGREFNPIAQWMIDQGDVFFILCKGIMTAICILFIMVHKNFKYSRVAILTGFSFYFFLSIYHIVLQIKAML
ncbi:MAG: hypothetical protein KJ645_01495 [Planctomycetes bacterium]|nr:hypothetical protein [Planctomycetota bacterium]